MRRLLSIFLVALMCIATSCTSLIDDTDCKSVPIPDPEIKDAIKIYKLVIRNDTPAAKVGPILDAFAEWTTVTDGRFVFTVEYADFDKGVKPDPGEIHLYLGPKEDPKSNYIGWARWWADSTGRPSRAIVWIQDDLWQHKHYLVALHELGHALGLPHSDSTSSIMYPIINDIGDKIPCLDRKSICEKWQCNPGC